MATRINILISYDVDTTTPKGRKRLRDICKVCKAYGQRVQYSVFECAVTEAGYALMIDKALEVIDQEQDSLRIYRLPGKRQALVTVYGKDHFIDFERPLIV